MATNNPLRTTTKVHHLWPKCGKNWGLNRDKRRKDDLDALNSRDMLVSKWVFPNIGVPQNGWFIMDNLIKMDDLGVPLFSETSK